MRYLCQNDVEQLYSNNTRTIGGIAPNIERKKTPRNSTMLATAINEIQDSLERDKTSAKPGRSYSSVSSLGAESDGGDLSGTDCSIHSDDIDSNNCPAHHHRDVFDDSILNQNVILSHPNLKGSKQQNRTTAAFAFTISDFTKFRLQYILAYIGIMLADGLQGMCSLEAKSGMYDSCEQKIRRNECSQFSHPCKSSPTLAQALIFMSYMKDTASRSPPSIPWDLSRGPSHHPSPELLSTGSAERRQPCYTVYWKSSSTTWSSIPYSRDLC